MVSRSRGYKLSKIGWGCKMKRTAISLMILGLCFSSTKASDASRVKRVKLANPSVKTRASLVKKRVSFHPDGVTAVVEVPRWEKRIDYAGGDRSEGFSSTVEEIESQFQAWQEQVDREIKEGLQNDQQHLHYIADLISRLDYFSRILRDEKDARMFSRLLAIENMEEQKKAFRLFFALLESIPTYKAELQSYYDDQMRLREQQRYDEAIARRATEEGIGSAIAECLIDFETKFGLNEGFDLSGE